MLYTLLKFLGWGLLLALIGGCVGWALRALKCRGELARVRSSDADDEEDEEVERMRHRLANLEQVVAERDRLRIQLADVRHADSPGIVGAEIPEPPGSEDESASASVSESADVVGADDAEPMTGDIAVDGIASADESETAADVATDETDPLDLDAAAAELGRTIELDDLSVVEGIGPKISELCNGIGVTTWRQLADTDVAELQAMLDAAGSRYTVHKPGTWPQQAELLANGRWAEFKALVDDLEGGR